MKNTTETKRITLSSINGEDKRYQVREIEGATYGEKVSQADATKNHINLIVKALKDNPKLRIEPIKVVEDSNNQGTYLIVDGFHRYNAYLKINKHSKGKRYKQLRVEVYTNGVPPEDYLAINAEHQALPLTAKQRTEQQWQAFLHLKDTEPTLSIKETSERLGVATSTVSNWRRVTKEFEAKGFFEAKSGITQSPLGYPFLAACKAKIQAEERGGYADHVDEDSEALTEKDKELLETILKQVVKADNPEHLKAFADYFWGSNPKHVPYDLTLAELESEDDF
ncbi:hypothetical protein P7M36_10120 [Vibrio parahaemolyticus]|nr:hypothetical protein [Vibrio parahaemolyticus]HCH1216500.1 hypothetical protein [Vibrio parahaemolyticus]